MNDASGYSACIFTILVLLLHAETQRGCKFLQL